MRSAVTGGAGFLLAVLWFDLMFDVQVLGDRTRDVPPEVLASIAAYYRRVTTDARPRNRLVALAMLVTLGGVIGELARGDGPQWTRWASLVLIVVPVTIASSRTVPAAVRLATRTDAASRQSARARSIWSDHLLCLVAVTALLAVQFASAA